MILTTVFATAGAIGAGATAAFMNGFYFNKDNDKATLGWTAVFALAGGITAGGIGYGIEAAADAIFSDDEQSAAVYMIEQPEAKPLTLSA